MEENTRLLEILTLELQGKEITSWYQHRFL